MEDPTTIPTVVEPAAKPSRVPWNSLITGFVLDERLFRDGSRSSDLDFILVHLDFHPLLSRLHGDASMEDLNWSAIR